MNRLAEATSPYLLQHADNPVDWWPWSPEAFEEARRRDVPVLISVGYAACHWCHVMAHESFENDSVASLINTGFVAIKVDREERPDVDAVYMTATQAMTGQGGWPMTVFATPQGQPFFAGTYYPRPAFAQILAAVAEAWRDQRGAVEQQSAKVVAAISAAQRVTAEAVPLTAEVLDQAVTALSEEFDEAYGGFGGAPKFPPHLAMLFLLRAFQRTGNERAREMVQATAEQMARGGIYDQLAGGFARYAVDGTWTVPHFEKMLYDNALLLRVYTELWRLTGDPMAARVAAETAAFIVRDLGTPEGGFASALDADTDGVEGATYVWTPDQLNQTLGEQDGAFAADLFGVTESGTFEHGTSVLRLARDIDATSAAGPAAATTAGPAVTTAAPDSPATTAAPDSPATTAAPAVDSDGTDLHARWQRIRQALDTARMTRPQPSRDDKVVAEWNALAITALAGYHSVFGALTGQGGHEGLDSLGAAVRAGELLLDTHIVDGRLRRVSRDGVVGAPAGVLADYGCVATAFAQLHQATGEARWLDAAGALLDTALDQFADGEGGFHDTAADAETLVARPADPTDNATPSGNSAICEALVNHTALTGTPKYREAAEAALAKMTPLVARYPRFAGLAAAVGEALLAGPVEVAVAGTDSHARADLVRTAIRLAPPGAVVVAGRPDAPGVPLLANRPLIDGVPAAYVCRGFVCERPVTDPDALAAQLGRA